MKFDIEGFYKHEQAPNSQGDLTGEIEMADNGSFEGLVYDHASKTPEQVVRGFLKAEEGLDKLLFLKFPPRMDLANLAYTLQKPSTKSFEGTYQGEWAALPWKVGFVGEYGLFIAQIDMSVCGIKDQAEINLRRR